MLTERAFLGIIGQYHFTGIARTNLRGGGILNRFITPAIIGAVLLLCSGAVAQSPFLHNGESAIGFSGSLASYDGPDYYASSISLAGGGQFDVTVLYGSRSDRHTLGGTFEVLIRKTEPDSIGPVMSFMIGFTQSSMDDIEENDNRLLFGTRLALNTPLSRLAVFQPSIYLRFEAPMSEDHKDGEGGVMVDFLLPVRFELARRFQMITNGGFTVADNDSGVTVGLTLVYLTVPGGSRAGSNRADR